LVTRYIANSYEKNQPFTGYYKGDERFYIQKGDAYFEQTNLSRQSLLIILYEQTSQLAPQLSNKQLTVNEVSKLLAQYDSLIVLANGNKPLLSQDVLFSTFLHHHIKYPNQAWNNRVYSRVYTSFEVNETGQLVNINTLSPANTGFGFDQSVQQALRKLTHVKPAYKGKYVLPVSFTYTNRLEDSGTHVPLNTLATEVFEGHTLLDELVVPVIVTKPVHIVREVWGNK
jgi:TonB family protein